MQPFRRPARVRAQRLLVAVLACVTGLVSPGVDGRAQAATYLPFTRFTPDTDGGMLAITHITDGNALNDTGVLRRYRPDGSLDAAFGFSGDAPGPRDIANWVPEHVRRLADGRLAVSARRRNYLAIYDSSGQPTGSTIHFHPTQIQVIRDLEPLPDGRFIVAGVDTTSQTMLALIAEPVPNTNGTSTRHNLPISAGDFRTADIAIDASGRMFVTSCSLYRANDGCEVAVLSPSGAIDLGYGTAGRLTLNGARCSTGVRPDGSLIAACTALSSAVLAITAFDPAGRAIPTFPPNLIDIGTEQDVGLAVEGSGRFFVGYTTKSTHETAIRFQRRWRDQHLVRCGRNVHYERGGSRRPTCRCVRGASGNRPCLAGSSGRQIVAVDPAVRHRRGQRAPTTVGHPGTVRAARSDAPTRYP